MGRGLTVRCKSENLPVVDCCCVFSRLEQTKDTSGVRLTGRCPIKDIKPAFPVVGAAVFLFTHKPREQAKRKETAKNKKMKQSK